MYCELILDRDNPTVRICKRCGEYYFSNQPIEKAKYVCKAKQSKGLGDSTAKFIDKITFGYGLTVAQTGAEMLGYEDCGCGQRIDSLNNLYPYSSGNPSGV